LAEREIQGPESLTVMCPTCHERFVVRLETGPQAVACTFCAAKVAIPSRDEARRQQAMKKVLPAPTVEEYAIAGPTDAKAAKPARRMSQSEPGPATGKSSALAIVLECPTCHERVKATAGPKPGKIACPFCELLIAVPDQKTVAGWQAKKVAPRKKEEIGEYTMGPMVETAPMRHGGLFDRLAEIRREVAPPPPRWTFFSGVFNFPWRGDVVERWIYMSIGYTAIVGIVLAIMGIAGSMSGVGGGMVLAFFVLPIIWVTFFTSSYTAACGLALLEPTAAGLDRIEAWPDPNWKEWMAQMLYLGWIGAIPLAASYGLAELAGAQVELALPAIFFVLYPISLLSALEANSIWAPLTWPIVTSLFRWFWCWLMFYFLTGSIAFGLIAALVEVIRSGSDWLMLLLGPLVAAAILIYFRLLGRLAWRMTTKDR
jgi:hypothetical protein